MLAVGMSINAQLFYLCMLLFLCTAYIRRYEQVLSLKTVATLCHLSSLFVKKPMFWDFVVEALACKFASLCITVILSGAVL